MACLIQIRKQSRTARPVLEGPLICKGSFFLTDGTSEHVGDGGCGGGGNFTYSVGAAIRNPVGWLKLISLHSLRHWCGCVSCLWLVWYRHISTSWPRALRKMRRLAESLRFSADISCGDVLGYLITCRIIGQGGEYPHDAAPSNRGRIWVRIGLSVRYFQLKRACQTAALKPCGGFRRADGW